MSTGLAYSEAFLRHDTGARPPERADRLRAIVAHLRAAGTWDALQTWEPEPAEEATLELIHSATHVAGIHEFIARGGGHIDADTVASAESWEAALRAAGGVVE